MPGKKAAKRDRAIAQLLFGKYSNRKKQSINKANRAMQLLTGQTDQRLVRTGRSFASLLSKFKKPLRLSSIGGSYEGERFWSQYQAFNITSLSGNSLQVRSIVTDLENLYQPAPPNQGFYKVQSMTGFVDLFSVIAQSNSPFTGALPTLLLYHAKMKNGTTVSTGSGSGSIEALLESAISDDFELVPIAKISPTEIRLNGTNNGTSYIYDRSFHARVPIDLTPFWRQISEEQQLEKGLSPLGGISSSPIHSIVGVLVGADDGINYHVRVSGTYVVKYVP